MKKFEYSVSTSTLWASFDIGQVEAENIELARVKALEKLKYDFEKVNHVLRSADVTKDFSIHFNANDIKINEII
jgi:hypothetical protein